MPYFDLANSDSLNDTQLPIKHSPISIVTNFQAHKYENNALYMRWIQLRHLLITFK